MAKKFLILYKHYFFCLLQAMLQVVIHYNSTSWKPSQHFCFFEFIEKQGTHSMGMEEWSTACKLYRNFLVSARTAIECDFLLNAMILLTLLSNH